MGSLLQHDLNQFLPFPPIFVETGTYEGDSFAYALRYPFEAAYTIDISKKYCLNAIERFSGDARATPLQGDTLDVLKELLPKINKNVLFFLDAHYPQEYNEVATELPLEQEIKMIEDALLPKGILPRYIIDDLWIYEDSLNGFGAGRQPEPRYKRSKITFDFPGREVIRDYRDQGYLIVR